jgi:magnesium-transporting ATPase (P-type)
VRKEVGGATEGSRNTAVRERLHTGKRGTPLEGFWDTPRQGLLQLLQATPAGLTTDEAKRRLRLYGPNSMVRESRFAALFSFFRLLVNPLVIILLVASAISLVLGDPVGGLIIISIVLLSVLLNFFMEFQARRAAEEMRKGLLESFTFCTIWWALGDSSRTFVCEETTDTGHSAIIALILKTHGTRL